MRIKIFNGPSSSCDIFEEWVRQKVPNCLFLGLPTINRSNYFQKALDEKDLQNLKHNIETLQELPTEINKNNTFYIFIEENLLNSIEFCNTILKHKFNYNIYNVASLENQLIFKMHHGSSSITPNNKNLGYISIKYKKENNIFYLEPFSNIIADKINTCYIEKGWVKKFCEEANESLRGKTLYDFVGEIIPNRVKLKNKIFKKMVSNSNVDLKTLSFLLLFKAYNGNNSFDENIYYSFENKKKLFPFINAPQNLLNKTISFKKIFNILKKEKLSFINYLQYQDCLNIASNYISDEKLFVQNILNVRIRDFHQLHVILTNNSIYQDLFKEESIMKNFSLYQSEFNKLNSLDVVIPQSLEELYEQSLIFRNCSILYARDVVFRKGYIGFIYDNFKPHACVFFDNYKNIIEIAGIFNKKISDVEYLNIQERFHNNFI